ncbi:pilin [Patescibacteria group bacterium]|nr:pilin [Patescibacteria group bacterium]
MKYLSLQKSVLLLLIISFFPFGQILQTNSINIANATCVLDTICDKAAGETMFNCTDDCLDPGIPRVDFDDILDRLIEFVLGIGLMFAVIFLIWSGTIYASSSGDTQKAENAKKTMKYATLGIIVIAVSYALIVILDTIFTP